MSHPVAAKWPGKGKEKVCVCVCACVHVFMCHQTGTTKTVGKVHIPWA